MKRLSKYLVLLLVVLIVAACFVGCGEAKIITFKDGDDNTITTAIAGKEGKVYEPRIAIDIDEEIVGWYRNKEGTGDAFNFLTDKVEENTTLYVKIRTVTDRIVTFKNADEETLVTLRVDTEGKVYEPRIAIGSDEQVVGWYTDKEYTGTAFNFQTDTVEESITLYVKISTLSDTIVTFKNSNGDVLSSVVASKEGKINEPKVEVTEGVTLEGWYTDSDYSGTAFNFETGTVTESTTLYAKFSTNQYTVTYVLGFEPEEGEDITAPTQDSINHNGTFTVKAAPDRQEYMEFVGWSDGVNLYQEDDIYLVSTNNVVLIGVWNVIQYEVNFFDQAGDQIGNTMYVPRGCAAESPYVAHPLSVFEFDGWDRDISAVREDMDVNATFRYVPAPEYYFDFIPVVDNNYVVAYKVKFGADKSNPYYNPDSVYNSTLGFYGNGLWGFPDYYRGLPVIGFAQQFRNLGGEWGNTGFEPYEYFALYLPDTFQSIDFVAFEGCYIDTIYVGSGLNHIDKYAFNQNNIKTWVVSEENEHFSSDGPTLFNKNKTVMITSDRNAEEIVVPVSVTEIYPNFLLYSQAIRSVTIEGDVDVIGTGAFGGTNIKEFTINGSVKRLEDALDQADPEYVWQGYPIFPAIGASEMTYLYLKGIEYIGFGALSNCSSLDVLILDTTLEHLDHEALTNLEYLTTIKFAGDATESNNGKYVIQNNAVIEKGTSSIMLEDGETPGDVFIMYASYYDGVKKYIVPETVREFAEWAFHWTLAEEVILPEGIEAISGGMFYYAEGLKSLTIPSSVVRFELTDGSHGTSSCGNYSPFECCSFESITFDENCKITEFPKELFYGSHLKTITLPLSVTKIEDEYGNFAISVFASGYLTSIVVPEEHTVFSSIDGVLYNRDKTVMLKYPASKADETFTIPDSVLTINEYVAEGAHYLKNLIINEGLIDLPQGCFSYSVLETVSFSSTIQSINNTAFERCYTLRLMEFKSIMPPTITDWGTYGNLFTNMQLDFPGRMAFKVPYDSYDVYYDIFNVDFYHITTGQMLNISDQIDVSDYPDALVTKYEFMDGEVIYQTIKAKKLRDYPVPEPKTVGETTKYFAGWYSEPEFVNEITLPWTHVVNDINTTVKYYAKWADTPRHDGSAPAFAINLPFGEDITITFTKANSVLFFRSDITFEGEWTHLTLELYLNEVNRGKMILVRGLMHTDEYSLNAIDFDSFLDLPEEGEVTVTIKFGATFTVGLPSSEE